MNTRRIVKTLLIFIVILAVVSASLVAWLSRGLKEVGQETVAPIVFSDLEDGTYVGMYDRYRWTCEVEVTVENGRIVAIKLLRDHRMPVDVTSAVLFSRIKEADSLDVDVVAGATVSSIAYLKAVEDALTE